MLPQVGTRMIKMSLKITDNVTTIEKEVQDGDFDLNLKDHILHLPSFINPDICQDVVKNLKNTGLDKSAPYTDGLLNDYTDSYFDPNIPSISHIKNKVSKDALNLYAEKVRGYNWSYHKSDKFFASEMIVRRYNDKSEFNYHYDDIVGEIFPQWFVRRKNILTCNVYLNDDNEYEGGDLHFASCNLSLKPKIGDVVISPSNWMFFHKVNEITSGVRYSGTYWYYYGSDKKVAKRASHDENFLK